MEKIPKIIHYCWFGKGEKNELIKRCIESWKEYLPDYKIIEWNEENFDVESTLYTRQAYQKKKWAFVSDYVRLYALLEYGGIYLDTDVEVIKNLDFLLENEAFIGYEDEKLLQTAVIGSKKDNKWIKIILNIYNNKRFIKLNGELDCTPNVKIITDVLKEKFKLNLLKGYQTLNDGVVVYPKEYFCPKVWKTNEIMITKNTCTIHHYDGSWIESESERKKRKRRKKIRKIFIFLCVIISVFYIKKIFFN